MAKIQFKWKIVFGVNTNYLKDYGFRNRKTVGAVGGCCSGCAVSVFFMGSRLGLPVTAQLQKEPSRQKRQDSGMDILEVAEPNGRSFSG